MNIEVSWGRTDRVDTDIGIEWINVYLFQQQHQYRYTVFFFSFPYPFPDVIAFTDLPIFCSSSYSPHIFTDCKKANKYEHNWCSVNTVCVSIQT